MLNIKLSVLPLALLFCGACAAQTLHSDPAPSTPSAVSKQSKYLSPQAAPPITATLTGQPNATMVLPAPAVQHDASRFLAQTGFGANTDEIMALAMAAASSDELEAKKTWIEHQFSIPQTSHRLYLDAIAANLPPGSKLAQLDFFQSFWKQAATGQDQLRQRTAFALSEIFVISFQNSGLPFYPRGVAGYYDTLGAHAFGNFRDLLEAVAKHPMMGLYLSMLGNRKETDVSLPDENFARELMQLFTIGLYHLNQDGSLKLDEGKPLETYTHADVLGLAKALSGWSWAGPDQSEARFKGHTQDPNRDWLPMQNYVNYHSLAEKRFLGQTIPAWIGSDDTSGNSPPLNSVGERDLQIVLDTLFQHPNVGPFFSKQLIQRLVSSNPSPAYVERVAAAFADNGSGVRGDMKAVLRAILLDPEARFGSNDAAYPSRKLREPIVRMLHWMRAFKAASGSGKFAIGNLDDSLWGLAQNPLRAPSVFNFYRPGYIPPNTALGEANLSAPEMQITNEISIIGYLHCMMDVIPNGVGIPFNGRQDVRADYSSELALATDPGQLLNRIDLLLTHGQMPESLRSQILQALNSVTIPQENGSNAASIALAKASRVHLAIFLTMASPEYLVQK